MKSSIEILKQLETIKDKKRNLVIKYHGATYVNKYVYFMGTYYHPLYCKIHGMVNTMNYKPRGLPFLGM